MRAYLLSLLACGAAGCSLVLGITDVPPAPDASTVLPDGAVSHTMTSDAVTSDAPIETGADAGCTGSSWPVPKPITALNTPNFDESGARLSADERTIVFSSNGWMSGPNPTDLYYATRPAINGPWSAVTMLSVSALGGDADPFLAFDGKKIYFSSTRGNDAGRYDLFSASQTMNLMFGAATAFFVSTGHRLQPYIGSTTGDLYFTDLSTGTAQIMWSKNMAGNLLAPVKLGGIDSSKSNQGPVLSTDEKDLYYASELFSPGLFKVFVAHRDMNGNFDTGGPASSNLNFSSNVNVPSWISPDGCRLYLTVQTTSRDLYVSDRTPVAADN